MTYSRRFKSFTAFQIKDSCLSGLKSLFAKEAYPNGYRWFESNTIRQKVVDFVCLKGYTIKMENENDEDLEFLNLLCVVEKAMADLFNYVYKKHGSKGMDQYVDAVMELI